MIQSPYSFCCDVTEIVMARLDKVFPVLNLLFSSYAPVYSLTGTVSFPILFISSLSLSYYHPFHFSFLSIICRQAVCCPYWSWQDDIGSNTALSRQRWHAIKQWKVGPSAQIQAHYYHTLCLYYYNSHSRYYSQLCYECSYSTSTMCGMPHHCITGLPCLQTFWLILRCLALKGLLVSSRFSIL